MRKWYKYLLHRFERPHDQYSHRAQTFAEHAAEMGGYETDRDTYLTKENFFRIWYTHYHEGRLLNYDHFFRKYVARADDALSVASGRCANELRLLEDGYHITCSDLEQADMHDLAKTLFPDFKFLPLDILRTPSATQYDVVLGLSLIYLFDDLELSRFFQNVAHSLKPQGKLILDSAGSPDNVSSFLIHDIGLKFEAYLIQFVSRFWKGLRYTVTAKHQGYRRSNNDIIHLAREGGFNLIAQQNYAFLTEFRRSLVVNRIIKYIPLAAPFFSALGRFVPYTRMYYFRKRE
ncbi:MAG: class I SAM-dependent methyltransferase [Chloroflexi bacterium]|nr:class I SAM-dependent methyltransferase [Chloroflexota bacterium]